MLAIAITCTTENEHIIFVVDFATCQQLPGHSYLHRVMHMPRCLSVMKSARLVVLFYPIGLLSSMFHKLYDFVMYIFQLPSVNHGHQNYPIHSLPVVRIKKRDEFI